MKNHISFAKKKTNETKVFTLLMAVVFLVTLCCMLPSANAQQIFKQYDSIDLKIQCIMNGTYCSASAVCNASVTYPNGTFLISNKQMTNQISFHNYTFNSSDVPGDYKCSVTCCDGGYCGTNNEGTSSINPCDFSITATGKDLTISKTITYILIFIISLLIFLGLFIAGVYLPVSNDINKMTGYIIAVNNLKYVKLLCLAFSYLTLLFLAYFSYTVCFAYLDLGFLVTLFYFVFYGMAVGTVVFFPLIIYFMITNWIRDSSISDLLSRGLRVR